jgi:hypothetical protein
MHAACRARADERDDLPGDGGRPGRLAVLVVDHLDRRPLALQPDHDAHEVASVSAV